VLVELRLENYAVVDNLAVEFAPGLNLLTGETGAGKSILIDALALLLGEKAFSDVIRSGAERAVISAVFEMEGGAEKTVSLILETNGIDCEDESIILRREIAAGGKGRVFVNNQPATVAVLRQLAPHLATIHAQNESLLSFDAAARLGLLDTFAGTQLDATAEAFGGSGKALPPASQSWRAMSRTACVCSTSGLSRNARSRRPSCSRAKTNAWKPRSVSWPTRKRFMAPP
jgi:DNA repair protein RecN (Recombination protein N)